MCTSPRWITTSAHSCDYTGFKKIRLQVPCGHCAQCRERNALAWSTRGYFETKACFEKQGFVLFDTLTFSRVPKMYDVIPESKATYWFDDDTFDYTLFQKFMKRLRIQLKRMGYDPDDQLRYIMTGEFGSDDEYYDECGRKRRATNRPHYHVLFFCTMPIAPLVLSRCISDCWDYGRTDGVPWKSDLYVLNERVFRNMSCHCMNKVLYVQKYISKDCPYNRRQIRKIENMMVDLHGENWKHYRDFRKEFQSFCKKACVRHFQSIGFGFGMKRPKTPDLDKFKLDNPSIEKYGYLSWQNLNNTDVVVRDLPSYYENKLFKCDKRVFGGITRKWSDNALGYLRVRYNRLVQRQMDNFDACYDYVDNDGKQYMLELLDCRSKQDFAIYNVVYRHRLGHPTGDPFKDYLASCFDDDGFESEHGRTLFLYGGQSDKVRFGEPKYAFKYYGKSSNCEYMVDPTAIYETMPLSQLRLIDESFEQYHWFDSLNDFIDLYNVCMALEKQKEIRQKSDLRVKYREIGM